MSWLLWEAPGAGIDDTISVGRPENESPQVAYRVHVGRAISSNCNYCYFNRLTIACHSAIA